MKESSISPTPNGGDDLHEQMEQLREELGSAVDLIRLLAHYVEELADAVAYSVPLATAKAAYVRDQVNTLVTESIAGAWAGHPGVLDVRRLQGEARHPRGRRRPSS